jgi:hypothetical protein
VKTPVPMKKKKNEHPKEGADHGGVGAFSVRLLE